MHREYPLASFIVESVGGRDCGTAISYILVFNSQAEMLVKELREFRSPFQPDTVTFIAPERFGEYTIDELSLREVVIKMLERILPS